MLSGKARILRNSWGKRLVIPNCPHGIVLYDNWELYIIWVAGNPGSYVVDIKSFGNDSLNFTVDKNTGSVTVTHKDSNTIGGYLYIGA